MPGVLNLEGYGLDGMSFGVTGLLVLVKGAGKEIGRPQNGWVTRGVMCSFQIFNNRMEVVLWDVRNSISAIT